LFVVEQIDIEQGRQEFDKNRVLGGKAECLDF
jgi:hypothetical protein